MAEEANEMNFIGNDLFVACNLSSQHCCEVPEEKKSRNFLNKNSEHDFGPQKERKKGKKIIEREHCYVTMVTLHLINMFGVRKEMHRKNIIKFFVANYSFATVWRKSVARFISMYVFFLFLIFTGAACN